MKSLRAADFRRDLAQSIGVGAMSLALTVVTTPIMTRLFGPEAYGAYGLLNNSAVFIVGFCLLGLPNALAGQFDGAEQRRLARASLQLALMTAATALAVVAVAGAVDYRPFGGTGGAAIAWLLPVLIICTAIQQLTDATATAGGHLQRLARGRLSNAIFSRVFTVSVGWLGLPTAGAIALGDALGKLLQSSVTLARRAEPAPIPVIAPLAITELRAVVGTYRDFALYSNLATILPVLISLAAQVQISSSFTLAESGQYVLAQSIINLPTSLIALATAHIVFRRLGLMLKENPAGLLGATLKTAGSYILVGGVIMLPVIVAGPWLFELCFGGQWRRSGQFAAWLAVPQILLFGLTATLSLFRITRRLRLWFILELASAGVIAGVLYVLVPSGTAADAIMLLAVLLAGRHLLLLAGCIYAVRCSHRQHLDQPTGHSDAVAAAREARL